MISFPFQYHLQVQGWAGLGCIRNMCKVCQQKIIVIFILTLFFTGGNFHKLHVFSEWPWLQGSKYNMSVCRFLLCYFIDFNFRKS